MTSALAGLLVAAAMGCLARPPAPVATSAPHAAADVDELGPLVAQGLGPDVAVPQDLAIGHDGERDDYFQVSLSGPVVAFVLAMSDLRGRPIGPGVWDTIVGDVPIAEAFGLSGFHRGNETAGLALFDEAGTALNPKGTFPPQRFRSAIVRVVASDPWGYFREGRAFTLLVLRPDGHVDRTTATLL